MSDLKGNSVLSYSDWTLCLFFFSHSLIARNEWMNKNTTDWVCDYAAAFVRSATGSWDWFAHRLSRAPFFFYQPVPTSILIQTISSCHKFLDERWNDRNDFFSPCIFISYLFQFTITLLEQQQQQQQSFQIEWSVNGWSGKTCCIVLALCVWPLHNSECVNVWLYRNFVFFSLFFFRFVSNPLPHKAEQLRR